MLNVYLVTATLMGGTAGLPHVIVRFYTVRHVRAARWSAVWALTFIGLLYLTAPAVGVFAKYNVFDTIADREVGALPTWVDNWSETGLLTIDDRNGDGVVQYTPDEGTNELTIDQDIMVLANPEVAGLPAPVVGLVAAGGLAAALSTASGLLLVISSAISHDVYYKRFRPDATEVQRLMVGRIVMAAAVVVAGYFGVNPPGFVAQVVALAFGLTAASFPVIVLGIFWKKATTAGAVSGMLVGLTTAATYMWFVIYGGMEPWFGISAAGIGVVCGTLNMLVILVVSTLTADPEDHIQDMVENIRYPGAVTVEDRGAVDEPVPSARG
ncbi:VC_2705 family sodium/solute symporter [Iamia sp. SCSIO 61187]|uniref:VC_2705 family sodium/solute symporter n=1 Tax=Iamia sp. SCSIO 61187 TaxID=2722752 RepID=UPI001C62A069|nr:VC_2705 family sodium/solute symporter [Iamia sp. SCSIO 61187]QYG91078.1 VC_2705 family sodium/solute symporter [Iamia sp. SCSIO 61187]